MHLFGGKVKVNVCFSRNIAVGVMEYRHFLFCLVWTCSCVAMQTSPQYKLKGKEAILIPPYFGRPENILWKHDGNKVVEFTGSVEDVYSPYENRITLDWESAELSIKDLRLNDSGVYELEVDDGNMLKHSSHKLMVIDRVSKLTITCKLNDSNRSTISEKQAVLVCSAETGPFPFLLNFEWRSVGKVQPGPELMIPLGEKHNEDVYNCSVSNPLSEDTATFTAKNCYPNKDTSVLWLIPVIIAIFIVLVVLVLVFRKRLKACIAKKEPSDEESQKTHDRNRGKYKFVKGQNSGTQEELKNKRMNSQPRTHSAKKKTESDENLGETEEDKPTARKHGAAESDQNHLLDPKTMSDVHSGIVNDPNADTQEGMPEKGHAKRNIQLFESLSPNSKNTGQNDGQPRKYSEKKRTELDQNHDEKEENKLLFPQPHVAQMDQELESEYPARKHSAAESDQKQLLDSETKSDVKLIHSGSENEVSTLKVTEPYSLQTGDDPSTEPEDASSEYSEEAASDKVTDEERNVRESHLLDRSGDSLEEKHSDLPPSSVHEPSEKDANTHQNTTGLTPETHTSVSQDESKSHTVVDLEETSKGHNLSASPGIHTEDASFIVHKDQNMTDEQHEGENTHKSDEDRSVTQ
ncbi:uncharacterized protein LOC117524733 isoform X2 [Thalassophryne amazonica]|uniref:uncharacterized protein LOC117524733 isoform X2 n=1 Tax=Thalassophryne amazonica TaxID=390379 RepID=UPI0014719387|nr:uncharacterized protein LOC117524733 isoform X2 [Thalassophryne amazonica]